MSSRCKASDISLPCNVEEHSILAPYQSVTHALELSVIRYSTYVKCLEVENFVHYYDKEDLEEKFHSNIRSSHT